MRVKEALNENMKEADMEYTGGIHGTIRLLALEEGRVEGRQEGLIQAVSTVLENKFGQIEDRYRKRLESASVEALSTWLKNALNSSTADEVFSKA